MNRKTVALITGGAGAMGEAAATALLADGIEVVLADIDPERLDESVSRVGSSAHRLVFDVGEFEACRQAVERVSTDLGSVDILLNNAGILSRVGSRETTPEEWRRVMRVNLDGAFYLSRAVLPGMQQRGWGRIINTSSYGAKSGGIAAGPAYCASKGALISLTFSLAREVAADGITVNGIAPAFVKTRMMEMQLDEAEQEALAARIPVRRLCQPEEFGHVVRFLASPLAGFITGEIIDQNGGMQFD